MQHVIEGNLVDIWERRIYPAAIYILGGRIIDIQAIDRHLECYILPGFVDAHIHIESSMLTPYEFGKIAITHGTIGTISDPHEIANVCGVAGVHYMIEDARHTPLKVHFGAPSCVPATIYEHAGAQLDAKAVSSLLSHEDIYYLSEVMNYPALIHGECELIQMIAAAKAANKPIDGHAPGVIGDDAQQYFSKGISTDHECFTLEEARCKLDLGVKILIREGSAAKNFDALHSLLATHPQQVMLCSDDKHPDDLLVGHINLLVSKAIKLGYDVFDVLYAACIHPVLHYQMKCGLLRVNDPADFIVVRELENFEVQQTYIDGKKVHDSMRSAIIDNQEYTSPIINNFSCKPLIVDELRIPYHGLELGVNVRVIEALDGQLVTNHLLHTVPIINGYIQNDLSNDILKIVVVNRYNTKSRLNVGYIKNIGLKDSAIASTVAHDSHNIISVGSDDALICNAINALIEAKGGIAFVNNHDIDVLPLPIGGLMSSDNAKTVADSYQRISHKAKQSGCSLTAPFMTLSFMALPVIPSLKITDMHLFDTSAFAPIALIGD